MGRIACRWIMLNLNVYLSFNVLGCSILGARNASASLIVKRGPVSLAGVVLELRSRNRMPSLKMKSKVSIGCCLTEKKDLHVCPKSKVISKQPCYKIVFPDQVAEIDSTILNWQDVSSRTLVSPKVVASDEPINRKEFRNNENSESQQQQLFSHDSSAVGKMESTNTCTADIERIVSPASEPIDIYFQHHTQGDAGRIGDTDMPGVSADKSDERRSICGYETCDVSDFFISDMIMASLPFGDFFDDDNFDIINYISDYKSHEPTLFDVPDHNMVLPALEDDVNFGSTKDSISCEEPMMVKENASLYSALCQTKRNFNQDSDVKNDSDKMECFDPQLFIKNFTELSDLESNDLFTQIPKQTRRRKSVTLVLDLDETLVHSTLEHCDDADFTFNVFYNMKENTVYVRQRPNLQTFLETVSEMFEVIIFTASQSIYAKQLLDILDPDGRLISRRVYRESCIFSHGNYIKDLTVLGRIGDTDMPGVSADKSDERRSICGYETCDVSDFFISDMIMASLPFGDFFDDDNFDIINYISDYKSHEPTLFDVPDHNMVLPALEDDVNFGSTKDSISCEEPMMVKENASLYSALCQTKRNFNQDSDVKNDSDKMECFDPQLFIKNFTELSDLESNDLFTQIPKQTRRRKSVTLVLDLDETLVHSTLEHCDDADFTFNVFYNMKENTVYVRQRPNLQTFLETVSEMFEVIIFTASQSIYAKQLLDILDPDGRLISRRVYRESCIFSHGNYIKDLTVLGVDLTKVAIIDNSPQVFQLQVNNGIPIKSWYDDPLDCALMSLLPFLEILADSDDVRPIIAQRFGNKD
ncbi:hypothetical protein TanjilG_24266 [Lupinus angustifolius]|uniref:protein-serine/threonine phosphatase n=1 Tax=Lupinus angustifolius TaxID=3871 RepID=A0A1J7GJ79_LUPAN|nr:hypothetical protein TanjilG_24266 [Lupinus angustifolius]